MATESKLKAIHDGAKKVIEGAIIGDFHVYPYEPGAQKEYPCFVLHPTGDLQYVRTPLIDDTRFDIRATLYLYSQDNEELEQEMDAYRSATGNLSIRAAVKTDDSLDGSCTYAEVTESTQPVRGADNGELFWESSSEFVINIIKNDP